MSHQQTPARFRPSAGPTPEPSEYGPANYGTAHLGNGLDVADYDTWSTIRASEVLLVITTPEQAAQLRKAAAGIEKRLRAAVCARAAVNRQTVNEAAAAHRPQESALPSPAEVTARAIAPRFSGDDDTCGAIDPDPQGDWVCTSYLGHGDDHGAWTRDGVLAHSWPQAVACRHCGEPIEKCDHCCMICATPEEAREHGFLVPDYAEATAQAVLAATGLTRPAAVEDAAVAEVAGLIEASTLGTPEAKAARERGALARGLHQLAAILASHPEAGLPYDGHATGLLFQPRGASGFLSTARALGCDWTVREWDSHDHIAQFEVTGTLAGLKIHLLASLDSLGAGLAALRAEFAPGPVVTIDKAAGR